MSLILALYLNLQECNLHRLVADKDPDARLKAVELIRRGKDPKTAPAILHLMGDEHQRVRARAIQALADLSESAAFDGLVGQGLASPRPAVREGTCEALGLARRKEATAALMRRLFDPDSAVRGRAAESLGKIGDVAAADRLVDAFRRHHDWITRTSALESLARLSIEKAAGLLPAASGDQAYQVRMIAAETWPRAGGAGALEALPRLLNDRDWRVRVSAIEACLDLRDRASVGWLADRLGREWGRLRWDIVSALHDLTGNDLGLESAPWKTWWEANKETMQIKPRPKTGRSAAPDPGSTRASFFKLPILSDRIIFILDLSGSMREPSLEPPLTKLDVAKRGMIETIRALDPRVRFGLLGLGSDEDGRYSMREQKTWRGRLGLLPASPEAKADAERFTRRLEARGWTNIYDAIEYAFGEPDVDTIFLYSDGGASRGIFFATGEILEHVSRMNRFRKIAIHTVEVPGDKNTDDNRRLLCRLAEESGGTCRLHVKK